METPIIISIILLSYYAYLFLVADIIKCGPIHNTPNREIDRLRSKYKVNIRTYQKNSKHWGFALFKSIYLNENLFKKVKRNSKVPFSALKVTFFHELYHVKSNHKAKILIVRIILALVPILSIWINWIIVVLIFCACAYGIDHLNTVFEKKANDYANKMLEENG